MLYVYTSQGYIPNFVLWELNRILSSLNWQFELRSERFSVHAWCVSHFLSEMYDIPVFAGLGSNSLFSQRTLDIAAQDAQLAESNILLHSCHQVFVTEIAKAIDSKILRPDIELDDFQKPHSLIRPPSKYHGNVVVQHTTLYLVQLLRYIRHFGRSSTLIGVAGFCAGLLPAVAVASSRDLLELLSQSQKLFYVALWLGVRGEYHKRHELDEIPCPPRLPWSVVVEGLSPQRAKEILIEFEEAVRLRFPRDLNQD